MVDKHHLELYQTQTSLYQSDIWAEFEGKILGLKTHNINSFHILEYPDIFYINSITKNQLKDNFKSLINTIEIVKDFIIKNGNIQELQIDFQIIKDSEIHLKLKSILNQIGMFQVTRYITPRRRSLVDLSQSLVDIKKNYHNKTLNDIHRAKKNGVKVIETWNINEMYSMYLETSKKQDFEELPIHYFKLMFETLQKYGKGKLLFATKDGYPMMVFALIVEHNNILYYLYTGSKNEFNKFNGASVLQDYIIEYAKQQNYYFYDLMGIRDETYGPSKFKLKFGNLNLKLINTFVNTQ